MIFKQKKLNIKCVVMAMGLLILFQATTNASNPVEKLIMPIMEPVLIKALKAQNLRIKCSVNDHFAAHTPVSVVFFYPKPIPSETIVHALENVLSTFSIFAGTLTEEEGQLYINCNNQGVLVQGVHSDRSLFQQLAHFDEMKSSFVELINPSKTVKQQGPLLTIKLSYYNDGMAIGYCWHHSLGDMATFMEFIKALSSFARGQSYNPPIIVEDRQGYLQNFVYRADCMPQLKCLSWMDLLRCVPTYFSSKKSVYLYFTHSELESLRSALSEQVGQKLSRNDVLCAHLIHMLARCRNDDATEQYASVITNTRSRTGMPLHVLGNYLGAITIQSNKSQTKDALASSIHKAVKEFRPDDPVQVLKVIEQQGGMKSIKWMIPPVFLPQYKNLIITNWSNFGVYSIDFGVVSPHLFLSIGESPMPWISCIVEGFNNRGLLAMLILPNSVANRLTEPDMLKQIHQYQDQMTPEEELVLQQNMWCM